MYLISTLEAETKAARISEIIAVASAATAIYTIHNLHITRKLDTKL